MRCNELVTRHANIVWSLHYTRTTQHGPLHKILLQMASPFPSLPRSFGFFPCRKPAAALVEVKQQLANLSPLPQLLSATD